MRTGSLEISPSFCRQLEQLSINAWPALETVRLDGWVLRFAEGFTRRANSVSPLAPPERSLDELLDYCEAAYVDRTLPPTFKATPASEPPGLIEALVARGYRKDFGALVQTCSIPEPAQLPSYAVEGTVAALDTLTPAWLTAVEAVGAVSRGDVPILARMLGLLELPACFVMIEDGDGYSAVGLGVREGEYLGLFDICVAARQRGRGLGTAVVSRILQWGLSGGATTAYLQVVMDNTPALRLYQRFGFITQYEYWYMSLPASP